MSLFKLKAASTILIEDNYNVNTLPLLSELIQNESAIKMFCYEQSPCVWKEVLKQHSIKCYKGFEQNQCECQPNKCIYIIDSVNQMVLDLGWNKCLSYLRLLQNNTNVTKLILILHKDCLLSTSKLPTHLHHISNAIISYDGSDPKKVSVQIKKSGKFFKSEETLSYDSKLSVLKFLPIVKVDKKPDEPEKVQPSNLSTFKIETDQIQQLEKHKLKLPYMSKINEGQGKVYYEPDAVDDWDDEDPDDDLDI